MRNQGAFELQTNGCIWFKLGPRFGQRHHRCGIDVLNTPSLSHEHPDLLELLCSSTGELEMYIVRMFFILKDLI